jgi:hypothetical protein
LNGELFWLVFKAKDISVIIQPAGHIIEARMRAMLADVPGEFQEGPELDDKTAEKVPKGMIGRVLSRKGGEDAFEEARISRGATGDTTSKFSDPGPLCLGG